MHVNKQGFGTGSLVQEWCDEVLFANYRVFTKSANEGFNRTRSVAIGEGERVIYCCERPSFQAKNRLSLPPEIPMDGEFQYGQYLKGGTA